ncbi:MAG: AGE family epimerase/isomerase [Gammaproteobacteria bacterium]|nr:AGE family epimerase/isomerase [Gammaproteobacteria bacterium]
MNRYPTPPDDFSNPEFLHEHVRFILDFYEPRVVDPDGGFYQTFMDNGDVFDPAWRHLVSSTRFVWNYAQAYQHYQTPHYQDWARQGFAFLQKHHKQPNGSYAWELRDREVSDGRAMAYGHAFVMLAAAAATDAGIDEARPVINEIWEFMEAQFWEPTHRAYADERNATLDTLDPYRGQNANMHTCESLLAAYSTTGENRYLDRAEMLATQFTHELTDPEFGLIWEHYHSDWQRDMQYNIDKPDDLFKPWGFQPGHQVEWAKLLLQLNTHRPDTRWVEKARALYTGAVSRGWDTEHGGLVYGFGPDGQFADAGKYFWVQAEAFAAAWRLFTLTGEQQFRDDYDRLWDWCWRYLIDHEQGAWFRIRHRDGSAVDQLKSPPGKTDYHTMGACWDVLSVSG